MQTRQTPVSPVPTTLTPASLEASPVKVGCVAASIPTSPVRPIYNLRALGREEPPETLDIEGIRWTRLEIVKHDFFAATAFYGNSAGEKAVLKLSRSINWHGLPFRYIGRRLCNREVRMYLKLHDIPNIPRMLGRVGTHGFLHAYVEGRPLDRKLPTPDGFFAELEMLLREVHKRGIAYVDANKPQNILLGDDGKPHLIDFQISWDHGPAFALRRLQRHDLYHVLKHRRRMRPDELTPEELERARQVSGWTKALRTVCRPYFVARRKLFHKLEKDGRLLPSGSD